MLDENEVFKRLSAVDWDSIGRKLTAVARKRASRYGWHSGDPSILGKGNEPEDIAQTIIEKLLSGDRKWDPSQIELEAWLLGQVRSEIDNLYKNSGHLNEQSATSLTFDSNEEYYQNEIEFNAQETD